MFYFIHVQGQNALTTLLHLADDVPNSYFILPRLTRQLGLSILYKDTKTLEAAGVEPTQGRIQDM